jgi:hypothetical protein
VKTWAEIDAIIAALRAAVAPAPLVKRDAAPEFRRIEPCVPKATHIVIDRTPCPRCNLRGDIGCDHRPASVPQLVSA